MDLTNNLTDREKQIIGSALGTLFTELDSVQDEYRGNAELVREELSRARDEVSALQSKFIVDDPAF